MNNAQNAPDVICPCCKGRDFQTSEHRFLGMGGTEYTCRTCGLVMRSGDGSSFEVKQVGETYSNMRHQLEGRHLAAGELADPPKLLLYTDAQLQEFAEGKNTIDWDTDQPPNIDLKPDEKIVWSMPGVTLMEQRSQRNPQLAGGLSFRVTRGVWFHTGSLGAPSYSEVLKDIDTGTLTITSKRYVFLGSGKVISQGFDKVVAATPYEDAVSIARSNHQKLEYYKKNIPVWPLMYSLLQGALVKFRAQG